MKLWYDYDEVRDFHPQVEETLNEILAEENLDNVYGVKHHPSIPGSSTTPDFSIYKKRTQSIIYVLEVKRKERDVYSQRYWSQTRGYINGLASHWEPGHKYFAITNIETTLTFADRSGSDASCVLSGNPLEAGKFEPETHEARKVIERFKTLLKAPILSAIRNQQPEWADDWTPIISSFTSNLRSSIEALKPAYRDELTSRDVGTYELLRIFLYHFIRGFYSYVNSEKVKYFRTNRLSQDPGSIFNDLSNNYARALELDFKQVLSDYPEIDKKIDSAKFKLIVDYFTSFTEILQEYIISAIKQNHSPEYFFNLLSDNLYDREELHSEGKIMSDAELAGLLAELCIQNSSDKVIDPGCGDGALLEAAYDKLMEINSIENPSTSHQDILSLITGIEIDPFLTQLASFRLLMKNPHEVDESTEVDISTNNIFSLRQPNKFSVVLMNPPFLRNEENTNSLTGTSIGEMLRAIESSGEDAFTSRASQPNLYFYFVNYVSHYLKSEGTAGVILMSKFMNNKDAVHLKDYLSDKVEAVISYPKNYFREFRVTTSIVIFKKQSSDSKVRFLNIKNEKLLTKPPEVKQILFKNGTTIHPEYTLKTVNRSELKPDNNWRLYMLDPEGKFEKIENLKIFKNVSSLFETTKRGTAGNSGGSDLIFPKDESPIGTLKSVPDRLLGYGMRWNKINQGQRKFILTVTDLTDQRAINFPAAFNSNFVNGYDPIYKDEYLEKLYSAAASGNRNWNRIVNEAFESKVSADLIIPRADRTKHTVFYNQTKMPIVISTNFFYLKDYRGKDTVIPKDSQLKFITAYLLSSFGQAQFELLANDQEGLRKLEGFMVAKLSVIDPQLVSSDEIAKVIKAFDDLNSSGAEFSGMEGIETSRKRLDLAVAEIIYKHDKKGFESAEKLSRFIQLFLAELVEARRN